MLNEVKKLGLTCVLRLEHVRILSLNPHISGYLQQNTNIWRRTFVLL